MNERELLIKALEAAKCAYAPYSRFCVGAALLTADGKVYTGCNIENASYPATICAERVAISTAVAGSAAREAVECGFEAIAIVGGHADDIMKGVIHGECPPCGICRQVMAEFCRSDFRIILGTPDKYSVYTLSEMLPHGFGMESM